MTTAKLFIEQLQREGRYHFSTEELIRDLGGTAVAGGSALRRLKAKRHVATPFRGFHVVVSPEYRRLGCLPAEQFVPELMAYLGQPYYVALLSAASYYGAAHQKPQVFQAMVSKPRRALTCGGVHVQFISRADMEATSVVQRNTPRGFLRVASPAATALELVGYVERSGGLDNVASVLAELSEAMDSEGLEKEADRAPLAWVQRLGFVLERVGENEYLEDLETVVHRRSAFVVALDPSLESVGTVVDRRWNVAVNVTLDPDL